MKIVLTGAPGSGKSVAGPELVRRHPGRIVAVPEAATQVYRALGRKWDQLTLPEQRDAQRAIYRLQIAQEAAATAALRPGQLLLLDRGTVDGSAYWPDGPDAYWRDLGTTAEAEMARYDQVVILETAAAIGVYDGDASNSTRFEDAAAAVANAAVIARLWSAHPRRRFVAATADFADKLAAVERAVFSDG